jgi:hypothetical protein
MFRGITLLCFFILFITLSAVKAEDDIKQYNMDSFWVSQSEDGIVKIAAFNEGSTYFIAPYMLPGFYERVENYVLEEFGREIDSGDVELSLRMTSADSKLVMHIHQEGYGICVWGKLIRDGIEIDNVGLTDNKKGSCTGYIPGVMLGKFKDDGVPYSVKLDNLLESYPEIERGEISNFLSDRFTINIKKEFYFSDQKLYEELANHSDILIVERDYYRGFGDITVIPLRYLQFTL